MNFYFCNISATLQERKIQLHNSSRKGKYNSHQYYKNNQRKSASPEKGFLSSPMREQISPVTEQQKAPVCSEGNVGGHSKGRTVSSGNLSKKTRVRNVRVRVKTLKTQKS